MKKLKKLLYNIGKIIKKILCVIWKHKFFLIVVIILSLIVSSAVYFNREEMSIKKDTDALLTEVKTLEEKVTELEKESDEISEKISESGNENTKISKKITEYNKKIKEYVKEINKLNKQIEEETNWLIPTVVAGVCSSNSYFKTYMDYRKITSKSSSQYKLLHSGKFNYCDDGLIKTKDGGYIAVALGSVYGDIGTKYIVTFSTGKQQRIIKVEAKADKDTNNGCEASNGDIIELVIDVSKAKKGYPYAIKMGDFNYSDIMNGKVVKMEKVKE